MRLTDVAIRKAKPRASAYKLTDGKGLFLWVQPSGSKWWRYAYRYNGKPKMLALGTYPEYSLAEVREAHAKARKVLASGIDPCEAKKEHKRQILLNAENSFEKVAREWHQVKSATLDQRYAGFVLRRLEADIFPKLGTRPIRNITAPELLGVIRFVEARGALEVAHRLLKSCGQIFMYGIATGHADCNPADSLQDALKPMKKGHFAYLHEKELPEFLWALETYKGMRQAQLATKLLLLTFVRTKELRGAMWSEINWEKAEWHISAERMKMRRPHIVPLSSQALTILHELKQLNGRWKYIFPNPYKPIKCMSENAVLNVIDRMGYGGRATGHGFRHTASTILNEHGFNRDHIELQLAHVETNKVRGVYNHAQYLAERHKMMQWWADSLDAMRKQHDKPLMRIGKRAERFVAH
ncbi:tyrosine-type recombinase/integrase [bacterium]|nr:MAG: tyrosine-type recombinase/integrase [bacterium]